MDFITPFFFIAVFKLLMLVWSDLKELLVDERHSTFMMGVVVIMYALEFRMIELIIVLLVSQFFLAKLKSNNKWFGVGKGDLSILAWVVAGLWFFNWTFLVVFLIGYIGLMSYFYFILNKKSGYPLTICIAFGFILTWAVQGIGLI
jgi:hypothetical protein